MRRTTLCIYSAAGLLRHTADIPVTVARGARLRPPFRVYARFGEGAPGKGRSIADSGSIDAGTGGVRVGGGALLRPGICPANRCGSSGSDTANNRTGNLSQ
jgi:hypothetical protein